MPPSPPVEHEEVKKEKKLWFEVTSQDEKYRSSVNSSFNSTSTGLKLIEKPIPLE